MINRKEFVVGKTKAGADNPVLIVAEIGINFDGKYKQALSLIDSAANAGCNAVKFQLFTAERMYPRDAGKYKTARGERKDIVSIVKEGELSSQWIPELKNYAHKNGVEFFCTVCDEESGDIAEKYGADAYKIASYEITHIPLLRHIARKHKPVIFSCGGASLQEVADAVEIFREEENDEIAVMHCVALYPAAIENLNLKIINTLQLAFPDAVIGYSDHSIDAVAVPRAAVALGAKIIEKHITLDKNLPGPDHSFALDPAELELMVKTIRRTEKEMSSGKLPEVSAQILGSSEKKVYEEEKDIRDFAFRCLFASKDLHRGDLFAGQNIAVLRPGENRRGIDPKYYELLTKGYRAARDIPAHKSIGWDDILQK